MRCRCFQSNGSPPNKRTPDYPINVGTATRILRDELPNFFERGLTTLDIYSKDVAFVEPYHLHFRCSGRRWYKHLASTARAALNMYFVEAEINVVKMQQVRDSSLGDSTEGRGDDRGFSETGPDHAELRLVVRWIFEGTPRHLLIANSMDILATPRSVYEGVFVYVFDEQGLIKEHRLEAIHPTPTVFNQLRWWRGFRAPVAPNI